jgi:hypothetical protein
MPTTRLVSGLAACAFALTLSASPIVDGARAAEPAPIEMAAIEATAPLEDISEEAVKAAITTAVQKAARGALAMGLPWLQVQSAYVRFGYVGVHVVAMTKPPHDATEAPDPNVVPDEPRHEREPSERAPGSMAPGATQRITL